MYHLILRGGIESENKDFIKELEECINKEHKLKGVFDYYEVSQDEYDKN